MSHNLNKTNEKEHHDPTMADIFGLMKKLASKDDMDDLRRQIDVYSQQTAGEVCDLQQKVAEVATSNAENVDKIQALQDSVQTLEQEQLRGNICISGVPVDILKETAAIDVVITVANILHVDVNKSQLTAYTVANNKFIIASFYNEQLKRMMINKIRAKRSLSVEEVFKIRSNSQIYINDHHSTFQSAIPGGTSG